jgi:DNA-binding NarL/FixJ family response regulator
MSEIETQENIETNDIVLDILQRIQMVFKAEGALTSAHFEQIEREIRQDWNGERPYIGKQLMSDEYISSRRREIIRMARAGESFSFIGRRFGISRQRAYAIFKG